MDEQYLTINEVAERYGVSISAVYQAIYKGRLDAIAPRQYLVRLSDAEYWNERRGRYHKRGKQEGNDAV